MAMWVVQAHREGRWATWGLQGLDLVIQRSGMGAVPGCTRAGLPMVARRGSEVRGKLDKGDKPRKKWCARCVEVHRRVCRWAHPSVHLHTPCTPFFPGLVTLIQLSSDLGPPSG